MAVQLQSMTEGNLSRQILRFSAPLMLSNVLQVLFNMSDIAVVGRFAGATALGAVGCTSTVVYLFTGFLIGMGSGVNVLCARFYGARNRHDMEKTVHTAAITCLLAGLVLLLAGQAVARWLLTLLHTRPEHIDGAVLYLRIYFWGMPALAMYNFGSGVLSAVGDTKRPLYYLLGAGVLNVALNLFFVIVCHLGVAGVALASILSQYLSAGLILWALARSGGCYGLRFSKLRLSPDKSAALLRLGIPAGLQNAIFSLANLFVQAGINSFDAAVVEGNAAAANADGLVYDVMAAFYTACSSFIGQNYGAGKKDRILKSYFISLFYSAATGILIGLSLLAFGRHFLALFATDPAVIDAGMERLRVMGLCYGFSAFMDCTIAASRGLGKSIPPMILVILGSCVFRIIWVYTVFAWFRTVTSLYLLYICSWTVTALAEIIYFVHCYRKQIARM